MSLLDSNELPDIEFLKGLGFKSDMDINNILFMKLVSHYVYNYFNFTESYRIERDNTVCYFFEDKKLYLKQIDIKQDCYDINNIKVNYIEEVFYIDDKLDVLTILEKYKVNHR